MCIRDRSYYINFGSNIFTTRGKYLLYRMNKEDLRGLRFKVLRFCCPLVFALLNAMYNWSSIFYFCLTTLAIRTDLRFVYGRSSRVVGFVVFMLFDSSSYSHLSTLCIWQEHWSGSVPSTMSLKDLLRTLLKYPIYYQNYTLTLDM